MVEIVSYDTLAPSFYRTRVDNLFYSERWLAVLHKTYGYTYLTVLHPPTGQFLIVTPLDSLAGKKITSLPFCDYTPIDITHRESLVPMVQALQEKYPQYRIILKARVPTTEPETHNTEVAWLGEPTRSAYYHLINTSDPTQLAQSSSFRRGVKKAQKADIRVEVCTDETALRTFYQMYYRLRFDKFNSIPQPYEFFLNVYQEFIAAEQGFILQARRQQKVIASIIVLQHRATLYYKFGCSDQEGLSYRPNNLLFQRLIELAIERDCVAIDLGLSGTSASYEGLVRFKESMGGVRHAISYFTFTPDGYDAHSEQECKTMLSALTKTIVDQRLGIEATSKLSATIYPYFA